MATATTTTTRARAKTKAVEAVAEALAPSSLGSEVDKLFDLREAKRELEAKAALIEAEYKEVEERVLRRMEEEKSSGVKSAKASASITLQTVATVEDWKKVDAYIKKTGALHLLQRRIFDAAYREILEGGKKVPGVSPFTKKRLNLRAAS